MSNTIEIRLSGSGGQGLQLSASVLAEALAREGKCIAQSQSYEPTSRGGISRSDLVVGDTDADYPLVTRLDYLVILDDVAAGASDDVLGPGVTVLCDAVRVRSGPTAGTASRMLQFSEAARNIGSERVANMVALGSLVALSRVCTRSSLEDVVRADTPAKFLDLNLEALDRGFRLITTSGQGMASSSNPGGA